MEKELKIVHHGRTVVGKTYMPDGIGKCPVVIFSHGYNGVGSDFMESALELNRYDIAAVCYDFCGGSVRSKSDMKTVDMTIFTEKEDLDAVLNFAKSSPDFDKDNIYVFGGSQGGLVTALIADERPEDIKGTILLYPALCIPQNWRDNFPNVEDIPEELELWGMKLGGNFFRTIHDYDVFEHIGKYPGKTLFMHGDKDSVVLISFSHKARLMYKDAKMVEFPGEGHGFSPEGNAKMTEILVDFICETSGIAMNPKPIEIKESPFKQVPESYKVQCDKAGKIESLKYTIENPLKAGETIEKNIYVYIPYGYDSSKKYEVLYCLHGGEGDPEAYFGENNNDSQVKRVLDHMIANGDIEPMIAVAPTYYNPGQERDMKNVVKTIENFCNGELIEKVIPVIEGTYSTYAETTDRAGLKASRMHRAYTGFSMGSLSTWYTFIESLDYFSYFIPMSGDCWVEGTQNPPKAVEILDEAVEKWGYKDDEFYIYAVTGDKDIAYGNMKGMFEYLKDNSKHLHMSAVDSCKKNIDFIVEPDAVHEYTYVPLYFYNGLPLKKDVL